MTLDTKDWKSVNAVALNLIKQISKGKKAGSAIFTSNWDGTDAPD